MPLVRCTRYDELTAIGPLPSSAGVALEVVHLATDESTTLSRLIQAVQSDPALSGRILKAARSTRGASARPIASVQHAVARLGLHSARHVALGFSVVANLRAGACRSFDYRSYWIWSLGTATAAREIARRTKILKPDEAYTCGLLSRVGRLALATAYPREYGDVLAACKHQPPQKLVQLEQENFATDHNELTAAMMRDWGLPDRFARAVLRHERLQRSETGVDSPTGRLAILLHVATAVAHLCFVQDGPGRLMARDLFLIAAQLRIAVADLIDLSDEVARQGDRWAPLLEQASAPSASLDELAEMSRRLETDLPDGTDPTAVETETAVREGLDILVADDDDDAADELSRHLSSLGHRVVTARTGPAALRTALEMNPQLAILDWVMPEMTGLDVCRSLRETSAGRLMYVIILTRHHEERRLTEAFDAGADDYVLKPYRLRVLDARIRAGMRAIRLQDEVACDKEQIRRHAVALAVANRKLERAALTDALTGLPNRRFTNDRLLREWNEAAANGTPLSCMMIDIDHFKRFNDRFGHDMGDHVLELAADRLARSARSDDVVCRYGGEEFVIICPDTGLVAATRCAERLRAEVENAASESTASAGHPITISVGVAGRTAKTENPEALLRAADTALYQAKAAGRNRVRVAGVEQAERIPAENV